VDEKDVFQKFYAKFLTKRLIFGTSSSDEAEKFVLTGLREVCGFEYTAKLQRMFNDIGLSQDVNQKFRDYISDQGINLGIEMNVMVLTSGSWPLFGQKGAFNVPEQLQECILQFQHFYLQSNNGRRLNWLHHWSKGDLKMSRYEIQATNFQMAVLLLFNNGTQFSEQEIISVTGIPNPDIKFTLKSLLECRLLLMRRPVLNSEGKPTSPPIYVLNDKFVSKKKRFKISSALQQPTPTENAQTRSTVQDDRKIYLQAAIVRIMKARKKLKHNELVQEVVQQSRSRFLPQIPMIKRCVEQLIEKEYLERTASDEYSYVA